MTITKNCIDYSPRLRQTTATKIFLEHFCSNVYTVCRRVCVSLSLFTQPHSSPRSDLSALSLYFICVLTTDNVPNRFFQTTVHRVVQKKGQHYFVHNFFFKFKHIVLGKQHRGWISYCKATTATNLRLT